MDLTDRREFLKLCVASVPALAFANGVDAEKALIAPGSIGAPLQQTFRTLVRFEGYTAVMSSIATCWNMRTTT
jgi:hypothetical protein